ncbi:coiled-coil domain-containing protein 117 [Rhinophrynus dorsalis]
MATFERPFNGMLVCAMDYPPSSDSNLHGAKRHGITESPFLTTSVSEGNSVNSLSGSTVNYNSYFNIYSQHNPAMKVEGSMMPLMENAVLSKRLECLSESTSTSCSGFFPFRRKHKRQEDDLECPLKKLRLSETSDVPLAAAATDIFVGGTSGNSWDASCSQMAEATVTPCPIAQSSAVIHTASSEEMEEALGESVCDAASRKMQDIESRLSIADEEDETEKTDGHLPTLIMSDVLKEGLKNGFEECLTKKIVESMNRPSMELVLWRPQPEFLLEKLQSVSRSNKKHPEAQKPAYPKSEPSFLQGTLSDKKMGTSNPDNDNTILWNREEEEEEEEMEL